MANQRELRRKRLDLAGLLSGQGSMSQAQSNQFIGLSTNPSGIPAPTNKRHYGYAFFTRPDMNMSYDNLSADRNLTPMLTSDTRSMARALRVMLDPHAESRDECRSDLVDPKQAFLPVLSNNLINMTGWPDETLETYTSPEGVHKEVYTMVDGTIHILNKFDVTANFRSLQGDPVNLLMAAWLRYASLVYDGTLVPYWHNLRQRRMDYNTRIYRFTTNPDKTRVLETCICGAAIPTNNAMGSAFNYTEDSNYNEDRAQISIRFECNGASYMDPIIVSEFNQTVAWFNRQMQDSVRNSQMRKVARYWEYPPYGRIGDILQAYLDHQMFPRVDPYTMEMEWWAERNVFEQAIVELAEQGVISS